MFFYIQQGGVMMYVILACSILVLVVFLERFFHLHRAQIQSEAFLQGIYNILRKGNVVEAVAICEDTPGPSAHIVRAAILNRDEDDATVWRSIEEAGLQEIPRLERNLNLLGTATRVLPMLGLLGTVLGALEVLSAMEQNAPLVHAGDLTAGLWVALLTTAAALTVAIPAYAAHNFLVGRIESTVHDMERTSVDIYTFLRTLKREAELERYDNPVNTANL